MLHAHTSRSLTSEVSAGTLAALFSLQGVVHEHLDLLVARRAERGELEAGEEGVAAPHDLHHARVDVLRAVLDLQELDRELELVVQLDRRADLREQAVIADVVDGAALYSFRHGLALHALVVEGQAHLDARAAAD